MNALLGSNYVTSSRYCLHCTSPPPHIVPGAWHKLRRRTPPRVVLSALPQPVENTVDSEQRHVETLESQLIGLGDEVPVQGFLEVNIGHSLPGQHANLSDTVQWQEMPSELDVVERLVACRTVNCVLQTVQQCKAQFGPQALLSALSHLSRASASFKPHETQKLLKHNGFWVIIGLIKQLAPSMNAKTASSCCIHLGFIGAPLLRHAKDALLARIGDLASDLSAKDISAVLRHAPNRYQINPALLDKLFSRHQALISRNGIASNDLASLLASCARLEHKHGGLLPVARRHLEENGLAFPPADMALCVWALSELKLYYQGVMSVALRNLQDNNERYSPKDLGLLLTSLTRQRYHPQQAFSTLLSTALRLRDEMQPADLANVFTCLGTFGYHPGSAAITALAGRGEELLQDSGATELCAYAWGLGMVGEVKAPLFGAVMERAARLHQDKKLGLGHLCSLFMSQLCSHLADTPVEVDPELADACRRAWAARRMGASKGSMRRTVVDVIKALGVRHSTNRLTRDGVMLVDIVLRPSSTRYVALQVCTQHDFDSKSGQLLGPARFERAVLERNGWEVKMLSGADVQRVPAAKRGAFVAELLRSCGIKVDAAALAAARAGRLDTLETDLRDSMRVGEDDAAATLKELDELVRRTADPEAQRTASRARAQQGSGGRWRGSGSRSVSR